MVVETGASSNMDSYESKRRLLFDTLFQAERGLEGSILYQGEKNVSNVDIASSKKTEANKTAKLRGQESIFKKPEMPISKCLKPRKTPDYQINPHKWKKYSLADVDISDSTNTSAAFSFLQEMEIRKDGQSNEVDEGDSDKPTFRKLVRSKEVSPSASGSEKPTLKGSTLVMPEYVIGQGPVQKSIKRKAPSSWKAECSQLKLSHLLEEEEEDMCEE